MVKGFVWRGGTRREGFRYIVMNQNAIYVYYGKLLRLPISTYVVGLAWFSLGF